MSMRTRHTHDSSEERALNHENVASLALRQEVQHFAGDALRLGSALKFLR